MKLGTFNVSGEQRLGVKTDEGIVDIKAALEHVSTDQEVPTDVMEVIEGGEATIQILDQYVQAALQSSNKNSFIVQEEGLDWGPCVTRPNKIICVGLNYKKHAEETGAKVPEYPILFTKYNNTLTGHQKEVELPKVSEKVDYEAELVIVIGKNTKHVSKEDALDHVFGYCNVNDISARDLQLLTSQWLLGKSCDGFSPVGPYLVTADEVGNPNDLNIKCIVNGEVRQNSNTSDMIFKCDEIVSFISKHMTLVPGDMILTGTPEGVVLGYPPEKQVYLQPGDEVTIEIEKLGSITNTMIPER